MEKDHFLSLCDGHNSIIHSFGCDMSCLKPAGICLRGCSEYEHRQKTGKHQFMAAREVYSMVVQIRHKYKIFEQDFKEVYLKGYIKQLKEAILEFQELANTKFQNDYSLSQIFGRTSDDMLQSVIEESEEELEFADMKCKDIHQIRHLSHYLSKDFKKEEEKRISKILTKLFQDHLRSKKLIGQAVKDPRDKSAVKQEVFFGKVQNVIESMKKVTKSENKKPIGDLIIKLKERILKNDDKQQQGLTQISNLSRELNHKLTPTTFTFAYPGELAPHKYWQDLCSELKGNQKLEYIRIVSSQLPRNIDDIKIISQQFKKIQAQMFKNEVQVKYLTLRWEQITTSLENPQVL